MELEQLHNGNKSFFTGFAESRTGGRSENQDSYGFIETERGVLITVCDGMGGGPGGKTASTIAVKEILEGFTIASEDEENTNIVIKAIRRANMAIIEAANETPELRGMGSTATVLLLTDYSAIAAHVGDSRIYQLRGKRKIFRTFDHSLVFDLVKEKVITEEQARLSANSNVITRALGQKPDVEVDIQELSYEQGDRFVLCSDGIHGTMPERELLKMLTSRKSVGAVADNIATFVDNQGRLNGGSHDNLTIAVLEMNIKSKLRPTMSKQIKSLIVVMAVICIISIVLNVLQAANRGNSDQVIAGKDSVILNYQKGETAKENAIRELNDSISRLNLKIERAKKELNNN